MMPTIETRIEAERGCGYRKQGGYYLVSEGVARPCFKLPIPLKVCWCCNQGIKPTRGFTWVHAELFKKHQCRPPTRELKKGYPCDGCALQFPNERMGLIWVGEKFYANPSAFTKEAQMQGVSRRISQVPKNLVIGKTWVLLAHRKAAITWKEEPGKEMELTYTPGIFHAFIPQRMEYVVRESDTEEKLTSLQERGFTLIKVIRDIDAQIEINSQTQPHESEQL